MAVGYTSYALKFTLAVIAALAIIPCSKVLAKPAGSATTPALTAFTDPPSPPAPMEFRLLAESSNDPLGSPTPAPTPGAEAPAHDPNLITSTYALLSAAPAFEVYAQGIIRLASVLVTAAALLTL